MTSNAAICDLVLPCRDEAPALAALLSRVPEEFAVIVVDNGSRDDTADVAEQDRAGLRHQRQRRREWVERAWQVRIGGADGEQRADGQHPGCRHAVWWRTPAACVESSDGRASVAAITR